MRRTKNMLAMALAVIVSLGLPFNTGTVRADDAGSGTDRAATVQGAADDSGYIAWEKYDQTIYNTTTGLMSNKVSSMTQTSDGIVWIGTDEGLAAYDGNEFTEYGSFYHFDGVNDMITTKDGGVWFATTTYGGAIYLGSRFQHFDDVSEYASNYATSIAQGNDDVIYVGTLKNMITINPASGYTITELVGEEYYYVTSVASGEKLNAAVTVNGDMVFLKDSVQVGKLRLPYSGKAQVCYVNGYFVVGASGMDMAVIDENDIEAGVKQWVDLSKTAMSGDVSGINRLFYDDGNRLWVLTDEQAGYFYLASGNVLGLGKSPYYVCEFDGFESGFTDIMKDYQGNYWISSSKRGVLLLRSSEFTDELARTGLDTDVINAVLEEDGILYAATDSGIAAIDMSDRSNISNSFTDSFSSRRITDIIFYNGSKHVAVYGQGVYSESGELIVDAAKISRLQVVDGMLYVLTDDGCIVYDGKNVAAVYDKAAGMYDTEAASVIYGSFGRQTQEKLYIASHGAGIFVFADGKLEADSDENYGLPSKNVNDMAAYNDGFFMATDNGVAFYNGKKVSVPENMPEALKNQKCKAVFIRDNKLYAVCKTAFFIIELDNIFAEADDNVTAAYEMYDENAGFFGELTESGSCFMNEAGRLYLPCGKRIYSYIDTAKKFDISSLKLMIQSVRVDKRLGELVEKGGNEYELSLTKDAEQVDIQCSVLNFSNQDPYVRYIMPGVDKAYTTVRLSELEHIFYENLPGGSYNFWFELLGDEVDEDGEPVAVESLKLTINKEKNILERLWVRMVLLGAAFGILMYFVLKDRNKNINKSNIQVDKTLEKRIY